MTLLLATVSNDEVLMTSDGLSTVESLKAPGRTTLQKILPIPSRPVAIAQCGGNFLKIEGRGDVSIARAIAEWCNSELPQAVGSIANSLDNWIRTTDEGFFTRFKSKSMLWVAGFSDESRQPEFYYLTKEGVAENKEIQHVAGAGSKFLRGQRWSSNPEAWDIATSRQKQQGKFVFGGRTHQLRITPERWMWVEKPIYGTLGIEGDILPSVRIALSKKRLFRRICG